MHSLRTWNFPIKGQKLVVSLLNEWYSGNTLNSLLHLWENNEKVPCQKQKEYIKILCYNVEGWGTRALEAVDLVYKTQASICIFTEVGELWNMSRLPHFNTFYQKGTNKNGGVCIAVGKHLKATRVEVNIPNTVVVDITGLSEPVRIIGIYWPASQQRDLDDILSYVIEGTILSGDFNATVKEWNSPVTDRRGACVKEWIEENNLFYIPSTSHTSKRSLRLGETSKLMVIADGFIQESGHNPLSQYKVTSTDRVLQYEHITADKKSRTISPCKDGDLFWTLSDRCAGTYPVVLSYEHFH
ncbi:unnamed protein product [Rotaria sp. Silwood2]|nr:unnamed protein product [Rotaria sp. Silwood2]